MHIIIYTFNNKDVMDYRAGLQLESRHVRVAPGAAQHRLRPQRQPARAPGQAWVLQRRRALTGWIIQNM